MPNEQEMILQLDSNLFEVFWNTYGAKLNINKAFIKKVFLAVDLNSHDSLQFPPPNSHLRPFVSSD